MSNQQKNAKTLNTSLWIAQVILALTLFSGSAMKLFLPANQLAELWPWTATNIALVKITGVLDALAAIGLILPAFFNFQPKLTVYAAYGTIALMIAAIVFHVARGEASQIGINIFITGMAVFVAWGRQKKASIRSEKI